MENREYRECRNDREHKEKRENGENGKKGLTESGEQRATKQQCEERGQKAQR